MLRIYADIQAFQSEARELVVRIAEHDANLASQLRRSAQSVALNTAEGMSASGGVRRNAYATACREARECDAAIDLAWRWQYVAELDAGLTDRLGRIIGTLSKLARPAGR